MGEVSHHCEASGGRIDRSNGQDSLLLDCCAALDHLRSALDCAADRPLLRARLHDALLSLGAVLDEAARPASERRIS
jgi:hypothetical protein